MCLELKAVERASAVVAVSATRVGMVLGWWSTFTRNGVGNRWLQTPCASEAKSIGTGRGHRSAPIAKMNVSPEASSMAQLSRDCVRFLAECAYLAH